MAERPSDLTNDLVANIPADLKPRLLDGVSRNGSGGGIKGYLHRATHIALGIEASQTFADFAGEYLRDVRESLRDFAPHPFEDYTVNFFMGDEGGRITEILIMVRTMEQGLSISNSLVARWGDPLDNETLRFFLYKDIEPLPDDPEDLAELKSHYNAARQFIDAFRLMLAKPGAITINKGTTPNRTGFSRGRRTVFYTQSAVTIDLDRLRAPSVVQHTGTGRAMPNYGYRAHNCHSGGMINCLPGHHHEWIEIGGTMQDGRWVPAVEHPKLNATWECYHCGRRRWHRRQGERGSLKVGEVRQTYRVKKGRHDIVPS